MGPFKIYIIVSSLVAENLVILSLIIRCIFAGTIMVLSWSGKHISLQSHSYKQFLYNLLSIIFLCVVIAKARILASDIRTNPASFIGGSLAIYSSFLKLQYLSNSEMLPCIRQPKLPAVIRRIGKCLWEFGKAALSHFLCQTGHWVMSEIWPDKDYRVALPFSAKLTHGHMYTNFLLLLPLTLISYKKVYKDCTENQPLISSSSITLMFSLPAVIKSLIRETGLPYKKPAWIFLGITIWDKLCCNCTWPATHILSHPRSYVFSTSWE